MKKALLITILLSLSGCYGEAEQSQETSKGYKVEKLFTVDGCTVYRFRDDGMRYFSHCNGSVQWRESCGKNCNRDVEISTNSHE